MYNMYGLLPGTFRNKKNKINNSYNIKFKEERNIISLINKGYTEDEHLEKWCEQLIIKIFNRINNLSMNNCGYEKNGIIQYDEWDKKIVNKYKISGYHTITLVILNKEEIEFIKNNKDKILFWDMKIKDFYNMYKKQMKGKL